MLQVVICSYNQGSYSVNSNEPDKRVGSCWAPGRYGFGTELLTGGGGWFLGYVCLDRNKNSPEYKLGATFILDRFTVL